MIKKSETEKFYLINDSTNRLRLGGDKLKPTLAIHWMGRHIFTNISQDRSVLIHPEDDAIYAIFTDKFHKDTYSPVFLESYQPFSTDGEEAEGIGLYYTCIPTDVFQRREVIVRMKNVGRFLIMIKESNPEKK